MRIGIASSALFEAFRRGSSGLKGAGCWMRAVVRVGISAKLLEIFRCLYSESVYTIDKIARQYKHVLDNV